MKKEFCNPNSNLEGKTKNYFYSGKQQQNKKMKIICVSFYQTIFADGKFHVVPSGDLHVLRANLPADAATPYLCRVRNTLTGREENSPPYNLIIDGKCDISLF